jgi:hypothetical protein
MTILTKASTPAMRNWAEKQIDTLSRDQLVSSLVATGTQKSAVLQAAAVMALCMAADRRMGDAWLAVGQFAHMLSMQAAEKYAIYGDKMYPFSEKQLTSIVNAVIQAKEEDRDGWI